MAEAETGIGFAEAAYLHDTEPQGEEQSCTEQDRHNPRHEHGAAGLEHHDGARVRAGNRAHQRVLLARAIAQQPRLLLLDEPFNGVDAVSQQALLSALRTMQDGGAAVVVSTHDLALAHVACDEVCLLNRHQVAFGPTDATLTPELLRAAYGGQALELSGDNPRDAVIVAR